MFHTIKIFLKNASPELEQAILNKVYPLIDESEGWIEATIAKEKRILEGSNGGKQ